MKQPVHSIVRKAAIFAGILVCLNCGDCGPSPDEVLERNVFFANGTNSLDVARAELFVDQEVLPIPGNVAFGQISAKHKFVRSGVPMMGRVLGVSKAWTGTSDPRTLGTSNLVVSTSIPGENFVDLLALGRYANPIVAIVRDRGTPVDVYVTAPGADITTLTKDATISRLGEIETLPVETLHPNTNFQVRLTQAGTKNVVVDFGTQAGLPGSTYRLLLAIHSVDTLTIRAHTLDLRP